MTSAAAVSRVPVRAWALPAVLAAVAVQTWFRVGKFIAVGDVAPFLRRGLRAEFGSLWGHQTTGAGSSSYGVARFVEVAVLEVVGWLGGSPTLAQRVFFTLIAAFAVGAVAWFASVLVPRTSAAWAAGAVAFLNPFWFSRLPNPLILVVTGYIAFFGGVLVRAARGNAPRVRLVALASIGCSYLALNPPLIAVLGGWVALVAVLAPIVVGAERRTSSLVYLLRLAPLAMLLNSWWLVPWLVTLAHPAGFAVAAETSPFAWAWTQARNSPVEIAQLSAHWAWGKPEFIPVSLTLGEPAAQVGLLVLPIAVATAPAVAVRERRRLAWSLFGLAVVLAFLSKGLHEPFASVNAALYRLVPGSYLLREPFSKLGPVLVVAYALLAALVVDGLASREWGTVARAATKGVAAFASGALFLVGFPMWSGAVVPTARPTFPSARVAIPSYWNDAAAAINDRTVEGKLLALPLNDYYQMPTTWGYYGVDALNELVSRPVLQRLPGGYFRDRPAFASSLTAVEQAVALNDVDAVAPLLRSLDASLVLVRGDLDLDMVENRNLLDPAMLDSHLAGVPALELVNRFGPLSLYRVTGAAGREVYADAAVVSGGGGDAMAAAVASLGDDVAVVGPEARSSLVRADVPVRTVTALDRAGTDVRYEVARPSTVHTRLAGGRVVTVEARDGALTARDAWVTAVDGVPMSGAALGSTPVSGSPVAVTSGEDAVALVDGRATLQAAPGTEVLGALYDGGAVDVEGPSAVGDCNARRDGLSGDQLGIGATVTDDGVSLSARAHRSCVSWSLGDGYDGRWLRLGLDHRSSDGRGARVCLYAMAAQKCLPVLGTLPDADWTSYSAITHVPTGAGELRLYAYADGPENVDGRPTGATSRADFRRVAVERLVEGERLTVDGLGRVPAPFDLEGPAQVSVTTQAPPVAMTPWSPLGDCYRFDERDASAAGLSLGASASRVVLSADAHSACTSSRLTNIRGASLLDVSLRYRRTAGPQDARICVYDHTAGRCLDLVPVGGGEPTRGAGLLTSSAWRRFAARVRVPANAGELSLYVYADGSGPGVAAQRTTIEYSDVAVSAVAPMTFVVAERQSGAPAAGATGAPSRSTWTRPGAFGLNVGQLEGPSIVAVHESHDEAWTATGSQGAALRPLAVGYRAGWIVTPAQAGSSIHVDGRYELDRLASLAATATAVVLVLVLLSGLATPVARRLVPVRTGEHFA